MAPKMDENRFVAFLKERFPFSRGVGVGDDASVTAGGGVFQLITKDLFIENVHFHRNYYSPAAIARKSLAVNLSDIAAMGGEPDYFYLGFGYPKNLGIEPMEQYFETLAEDCRSWRVQLAGGDFSAADQWIISITMIGHALKPVFRHGAQTGDIIGVTGPTGHSALGLHLLQKGFYDNEFAAAHLSAQPEISRGVRLAPLVNAMIDVSDGLAIDLKRILSASGKGAVIQFGNIPISTTFSQMCGENNLDIHETVLAGGEDYVLLFTAPPENETTLLRDIPGLTIIGHITAEPGLNILHGEKTIELKQTGYDHFINH